MKTAFIIHGTGGSPEWNWFPSMKQELESKWYQVFVPEFPTPDNQTLSSWTQVFESYKKYLDEETIFVAHSIWPAFVCSVLEEIDTSIQACYFVSGFLWFLWLHEFDTLNKSFVDKDFDWEKIKNNSKQFYMCHGSDDPYVPLENAQDLAQSLWVEIDVIEWGGHLNSESGYTEFPYLLEKITSWKSS